MNELWPAARAAELHIKENKEINHNILIEKLIEVLAGSINIDAHLLMMGTEIFLVLTQVTE
jgi:hypothetical protein